MYGAEENTASDFFQQIADFETYLAETSIAETPIIDLPPKEQSVNAENNEFTLYMINATPPKKSKRTFAGTDIINKKKITDTSIKTWIFFTGEKGKEQFFGGECPKCNQELWVKKSLNQDAAKKILIADFANHKNKHCIVNQNANRVKRQTTYFHDSNFLLLEE